MNVSRLYLRSRLVLAATFFLPLTGFAPAQTGDDDGWEMVENTAQRSLMAMSRYDNGVTLAVRCQNKRLDVMILGLPISAQDRPSIFSQLNDLPETRDGWVSSDDKKVQFSNIPTRYARVLTKGGQLSLTPVDGEGQSATRYKLDLPTNAEGIHKVLTACDQPLSDPRLADLPLEWDLNQSNAWRWVRRVSPAFPTGTSATSGQATLLCTMHANGRLKKCDLESEFPAGAGFGQSTLRASSGGQFVSDDPAQPIREDTMISFTTRFRLE